jgi:glycosyltransferase involved in cell wall biosynthesis
MNIGIIHYHLKPGGVTTVIGQHVRATRDRNRFLIFSGEAPCEGGAPAPTEVVPEIAYDRADGRPACHDPEATAAAIVDRLGKEWRGGPDVIHIHNPWIAKNRHFLKIIRALAARGQRLLLQIHDFAEDGRPGACYRGEEYPDNCHLAVINTRDHEILIAAGASPEGVHYVGNAVTPLPEPDTGTAADPVMLYPVRAIRRKNIGEAILLSLFFENRSPLAISLAPGGPADTAARDGWKSFCRANPVKVFFEASSRRPFSRWVAACRGMISTSVSEGFGYALLEPWTAQKPLFGRKIPGLHADAEAAGLRLGHLYPRLSVPAEWLDTGRLREKISRAVTAGTRAFGLHADADAEAFAALADHPVVDFGLLDESFQKPVIHRVLTRPADRRRLVEENPFLAAMESAVTRDTVLHNNRLIRKKFSEQTCGERLMTAYGRACATTVLHRISRERLLSRFLHPGRFSLLQWGPYDNA